MTKHAAPAPSVHGPERARPLGEHQAAVIDMLIELADLAGYFAAAASTRHQGLGFLTYEGLQAQDQQVRRERFVARWNARQMLPQPSSPSPTPGDMAAMAADAALVFSLVHAGQRLTADLKRSGRGNVIPWCPAEPDTHHLVVFVDTLVRLTTNTGLVERIRGELDRDLEAAKAVVDGPPRVAVTAHYSFPCPHCGHHTLVWHPREDYVRCEGDPKRPHPHPCICNRPICACKTNPVTYRHTWYRTGDPRLATDIGAGSYPQLGFVKKKQQRQENPA